MTVLRFQPLASGSRGNAALVELAGMRVLVEAGLAARTLEARLRAAGVSPESLDLILVSHEHRDHAQGLERFSQRHRIPVAASAATLDALDLSPAHLGAWLPVHPGRVLEAGALEVLPFSVPHDAADPVGFRLEGGGVRVGVVTDLGRVTTLVTEMLREVHVLLVEANHDEDLLRDGPYPWHLKQRVSGSTGHLSNREAASLVRRVAGRETRCVFLGHLSEKNNTPALARGAVLQQLRRAGRTGLEVRVAPPQGAAEAFTM